MTPYRFRPDRDLPLIGLGLAGALAVLVPVAPVPCLPECVVPSGLNPLDRLAVGGFSASALVWANVLVTLLVAAPVTIELIAARGRSALQGILVFGVAVALTQAAVQLTKFAVGRPAPFVYTPELVPESALYGLDAARSFISGHTATAFVGGAFLTVTVWLRWPARRARFLVLLGAVIAASAAGALKVVAGYHYWTDVLAGGLAGGSIAVLVALTHRSGASEQG